MSPICFLSIYYITILIKGNWTGRVCVELRLTRVSWKKLLQPRIYTCKFVMILCILIGQGSKLQFISMLDAEKDKLYQFRLDRTD